MKNYDLIVIGGGTAGCAAAYMAGISGLKVLLLEKSIHLGGAITSGLVVPAMQCGKNQINTEFFDALVAELQTMGGQVTYQDNQGWFNPELTKIALDNLMAKAAVEVLLGATISNVTLTERRIESIQISNEILSVYNDTLQTHSKLLSEPIWARYYIDATGNCDFGKFLNCEFLEKENENQPVSLRFIMDGVDLKTFAEWLREFDKDRNVTTVEEIEGEIHLSTAYTWDSCSKWALAPLFDDAVEKGILKDHDRNYFQLFTIPQMSSAVAFNCPRVVEDTEPMDIESTSKALISARQSIFRLSNFCKTYLKGFEKAYISNIADALGVRVSRRIKGKYIYTIDDIKSSTKFEHPVLRSNYPIDVHSREKDGSTLHMMAEYELPLESLMSADYDNLFVVGRCISADFMAQGALRVQPNCFAMGVGVAKHIASLESQA